MCRHLALLGRARPVASQDQPGAAPSRLSLPLSALTVTLSPPRPDPHRLGRWLDPRALLSLDRHQGHHARRDARTARARRRRFLFCGCRRSGRGPADHRAALAADVQGGRGAGDECGRAGREAQEGEGAARSAEDDEAQCVPLSLFPSFPGEDTARVCGPGELTTRARSQCRRWSGPDAAAASAPRRRSTSCKDSCATTCETKTCVPPVPSPSPLCPRRRTELSARVKTAPRSAPQVCVGRPGRQPVDAGVGQDAAQAGV